MAINTSAPAQMRNSGERGSVMAEPIIVVRINPGAVPRNEPRRNFL